MAPPLERSSDSSAQLLNVLVSHLPWPGEEQPHTALEGDAVPAPAPPTRPGAEAERRPNRQSRRGDPGAASRPRGVGGSSSSGVPPAYANTGTGTSSPPRYLAPGERPKPPPPAAQKPVWGFASGAPKKIARNVRALLLASAPHGRQYAVRRGSCPKSGIWAYLYLGMEERTVADQGHVTQRVCLPRVKAEVLNK